MNFTSPYVDLPQRLTVRQNLRVYAELYGVARPQERIAELAATSTSRRSSTAPSAGCRPGRRPACCSPRR